MTVSWRERPDAAWTSSGGTARGLVAHREARGLVARREACGSVTKRPRALRSWECESARSRLPLSGSWRVVACVMYAYFVSSDLVMNTSRELHCLSKLSPGGNAV